MITEDMVREGIRNGSVRFVKDPNMEHGTVCQIGDDWFYFGCLKAAELDHDEYVKTMPEADVVGLICNTLDEFRKSGETFEDEYAYYEAYLNEQRAKAIPTLKERDKRLERLGNYIGRCTAEEMRDIDIAVATALGLKKYPGLIERLKEREQQVEKREAVVGKETDTKAALELATVKAERDTYRRLYEDLIRGFIPTAPAGA